MLAIVTGFSVSGMCHWCKHNKKGLTNDAISLLRASIEACDTDYQMKIKSCSSVLRKILKLTLAHERLRELDF